jgi:hypothetical protein
MGTGTPHAFEADGMAGQKEATPAYPASGMSEEGQYNTAAHAANNAARGWPAPTLDPENVEGSITPGNPTEAEGADNPVEYPYKGAPARTTTVGGGGNPEPEGY